jgi:Tfp pilus assembly protein PilX
MIVNIPEAHERKGFVLAAALLAVLLIAALVAGVFFASTEATRMGVATSDRQLALSAAESSIERRIAAWSAVAEGASVGETRSASDGAGGMPAAVYVTRLDSSVYWIVADAGPPRAASSIGSRIGVLVRVSTSPDGSSSVHRIPGRWWSEIF